MTSQITWLTFNPMKSVEIYIELKTSTVELYRDIHSFSLLVLI